MPMAGNDAYPPFVLDRPRFNQVLATLGTRSRTVGKTINEMFVVIHFPVFSVDPFSIHQPCSYLV